jgi:hypothetical protein
MNCGRKPNGDPGMTRRSFLGALTMMLGSALTGCSSLNLILGNYPDRYDHDGGLRERMLARFVGTIIPDARPDEPHLTRVFVDTYYPFHKYCGYFLSTLADASGYLFGHEDFDRLDLKDRTAVIERCLQKSGPPGRLATSAVFMAQYSYYAGIYDDQQGCPLIDFPGANDGLCPTTMSRDEVASHMARTMTTDGNPP